MFALVDCNNFYVSCERVFNPKMEGKPVIVLSNNDGCAIARSEEAKALGIEMGIPFYMIRDLIKKHDIHVFSSNYTLYGDMSSRVMQIITEFAPSIELYSIDEAFLHLFGMEHVDLNKLAIKIRTTVLRNTGIPVAIGIAPTKTLAKMANRYAKKTNKESKVHWIQNDSLRIEMLEYTALKDVWGIGAQYNKMLLKNGFKTAADLMNANDEWIRKNMSVVGQRLINELKGVASIKQEEEDQVKKGICTSRSFGKLVTSKEHLQEAVSNYINILALKLRDQKTCAGKLNVFIETNPYLPNEPQCFKSITTNLDVATSSTNELIAYALHGLDLIYRPGYRFMKAGVIATEIVPEAQIQFGMFDTTDRAKNNKIMSAIDKINKSMGRDLVRFAVQGYTKTWKLKTEFISKRYTTNMNELLTIKI